MSEHLKSLRTALVLSMLFIVGCIQAQTVKGTVTDSSGEPIIGATVLEKGTKNAAVTDFDGNYTIKMSGSNPLVFSYIGMMSRDKQPSTWFLKTKTTR